MSEQRQFILLSFLGPCTSVSLAWVSGGNLKQSSAYPVIKLTGQWFFLIIIEVQNRMGEERSWQTMCDKRENNFFSNFTFLQTDLLVKDLDKTCK